jgi:AcrR family transcriptional regulator
MTTTRRTRPSASSKPRAKKKAKASGPRIGAENSETRAALIDAAEHLLRKGGYSAVTSRAIGSRAGVKPQLVHYYFRTMDDVFLAVLRRYTEKRVRSLAKVLTSPTPLKAMWDFSLDLMDSTLAAEFIALSRRQKSVRAELVRGGELLRDMQDHVFTRIFEEYKLEPYFGLPEVLTVLVSTMGMGLALETDVGVVRGHAQTLARVNGWLEKLERTRAEQGAK